MADRIYEVYGMTTEAANNDFKKNVVICDTQPVAVEGVKWLIENSGDLRFGAPFRR